MKLLKLQFSPVSCCCLPLRPNIFLSILFPNTVSLCSSLNSEKGKIIVL